MLETLVDVGLRGHQVPGEGVWDESGWDAYSWSGIEPVWAPVGLTVERFRIDRGRMAATQRHTTGTAEVVLYADTTDWSFREDSPVQLGQEMRVRTRLTTTGQIFPLFRGTVRAIDDNWERAGPLFRLTVRLVDRFAELAAVDLPEQSVTGGGERTDQRLRRILDLAAINRFYGKFQVGQTTLTGSNFARNLLDEAQVSVESEIGVLYADRNNFLVFRGRHWWQVDPRSANVQLLWTNSMATAPTGAPAVHTRDFRTSVAIDDIENYISMARTGGNAQIAHDAVSIARYGKRTHQRHDLLNQFSTDVAQVAGFRLDQHRQRTRRISRLEAQLHPALDPEQVKALLDIELGDLQRIYWDDGSAEPEDLALHVQGVHWNKVGTEWVVGVDLWDYVGFTPTAGWNVAVWDTALWV